jgi:hypothetical protein
MKKFVLFVLKTIAITFVVLVFLDFGYTYVYTHSGCRNKINYVHNSQAKKFDIIFMGSSRANNHFVTQLFTDKGINAYNFGMSGAGLKDTELLLELMIERHYEIKNIILEVDLNINTDGFSEGTLASFMPYLHQSEVVRHCYENILGYNYLYYIPFYRYIKYDAKVGFREMFFSAIHKKSKGLLHGGYYALYDEEKNKSMDLSNYFPKKSSSYDKIKHICKINNINLISVMTPMCANVKGIGYFDKVNKIYPEIHNYEKVVQEDKYFSSCGHMNYLGARIFTARIQNDFFNK